jgi:hypothetical protein
MEQQIVIKTGAGVSIRPLLEAAVQNEQKLLSHGIRRTKERLAAFERRFNMSSAEFERKYTQGDIEETLDFSDWMMEIKALQLLEQQHQALGEARFD